MVSSAVAVWPWQRAARKSTIHLDLNIQKSRCILISFSVYLFEVVAAAVAVTSAAAADGSAADARTLYIYIYQEHYTSISKLI